MKNFQDWCIENEQFSLLELYENAKNEFKSNEIGFSSSMIVNWKCKKCRKEWKVSLNKATSKTKEKIKRCAYCAHRKPSEFYNLITECPVLEDEWDYEKNSKKPTDYLPKSKERVWWRCKNGHSWESVISDRVRSVDRNAKIGRPICPFCNHKRVSNTYNLLTEFPYIAKHWNYIKNGSLTPLLVSPKSPKKVWWTCEYNSNHIWQDRIGNRTILNRKCPICSKEFTISFPARVLYYYLKQSFYDCEIEYKIFGKYILDIYIPEHKIIIEYDGWYYHTEKEAKKREEKKDKFLKEKNFKIIRIKESKQEMKDIIYENNIITYQFQEGYKGLDELAKKAIDIVGKITQVNTNNDINWKRDYQKIEDLYYHIRKSNSLAVKEPELTKEWSENNNILPDVVNCSYQKKIKWICSKCKREYEATVYNRVKHKCGCPYCSNRKVCDTNAFDKNFPEIAAEWNYEKNGTLRPEDVTGGCDKKVWWKCKNGHEWQARIYSRTGKQKTKCPICWEKRRQHKSE